MLKNFYFLIILILFICKVNAQTPDWIWAKSGHSVSPGFGEGISIATDSIENVYITGGFDVGIIFGPYSLSGSGVYVAKYGSNGNVMWAKGTNNPYARANNISAFGTCYLTGNFSN